LPTDSAVDVGTVIKGHLARARDFLGTRRGKATAVILVTSLVILAAAGATYGKGGDGSRKTDGIDISSLEPFNNSMDGGFQLQDGEIGSFIDFELVPIPKDIGEIVIVLINMAVLDVSWTDEADKTYLMATWENQPDSVRAMLLDHDDTFDERDEKANPQDGEGSFSLRWDGGDTYIGSVITRTGEHHWEGAEIPEYVTLKGGKVIWEDAIDATVMLVKSGDYTHQRIPYVFPDDGNTVEATYTLAGYSLSIPPPRG